MARKILLQVEYDDESDCFRFITNELSSLESHALIGCLEEIRDELRELESDDVENGE